MALFASQHIHQYLSPSSSSSLSSSCPSYSHSHIEVIALPCLSTEVDLKESMTKLDNISDKKRIFPTILTDHLSYKERQFAYPYPEHLSIFQSLRTQLNVDFDMIYAPRAMEILIHNKCLNKYLNNTTTSCHSSTIDNSRSSVDNSVMSRQRDEEEEEFNLMYYHCGGVEGNMSQLERYKAKGLL